MSEITTTSQQSLQPAEQAALKRAVASQRVDRFLVTVGSHVILIAATVLVVYPVFWMVLASLKSNTEIVTNIWGLPHALAWENYTKAWAAAKLGHALTNSLIVSGATLVLVIGLSSVAAFAFARFSFRLAAVLFLIFVFTMQTPPPIIPLYILMAKLHLTDSYFGLVMPMVAGGLPLSIFIFRAFFQSLPAELLEAAKVDGCTDFSAFLRVVVPISGPAIATVGVLQFVGSWNEYMLPLILIRTPEMRTIPLAIQTFFYSFGRSEWAQVFAALSVGSLPMIVLYVILQRQFIQGLTAGAIKG